MKIAALSRHRRVLLLCAGSAAVHLVLLAWFGARRDIAVAPPPDATLSVRLLPAGAALALPFTPPAATSTTAIAEDAAARRSPSRAAMKSVSAAEAVKPATVPVASEIDAALPSAGAAPAGAALMQMPGRYRVRLPAPALLTYALTRTAPDGGAPVAAGVAQLDWRTDGERYRLAMTGALGILHSDGASGDAGIVPRSARELRDGADLVTEFEPERHRVLFRANGAEAQDNVGIQDRASLLMQLAGIGLGDPDQVKDAVDVVVAGTLDARIAHLQVIGIEEVASGAGLLQAWHLAEAATAGAPRLDIWLAPSHGWLPVQLRVTEANGASVTQTLTRAAPGVDLAAPAPSR